MKEAWNLVADIGGTSARFAAWVPREDYPRLVRWYGVKDHERLEDVLRDFLALTRERPGVWETPEAACFAIAGNPEIDPTKFTNSHWQFSRKSIAPLLGSSSLKVVNDFAAQAYAIPGLGPGDYTSLGGGSANASKPVVVLGPGSGLGVATLVPSGAAGWHVVSGEGGHVGFAPVTEREIALLGALRERFKRVSIERLLSGPGIENIYLALAAIDGHSTPMAGVNEIASAAVNRTNRLAVETLQTFFAILGSVAGDLALTLGAAGGVYISGGITPRYLDFLKASDCRARFEAKGRFRSYVEPVPLRVITRDNVGLFGAARLLDYPEAK